MDAPLISAFDHLLGRVGLLFAGAAEPQTPGIPLVWGILSGLLLSAVAFRRERTGDRKLGVSLGTGLVWLVAGVVAEFTANVLRLV